MSKKTKPGPAPTWPLPHGQGQGPRPGDHTLPPLKKANRGIEKAPKKYYG
jgi:hypothetical protein